MSDALHTMSDVTQYWGTLPPSSDPTRIRREGLQSEHDVGRALERAFDLAKPCPPHPLLPDDVSPEPRPARDRPATDRAYDYTKEGITSGTLRGGDLISEGDVAQALSISRTPVREAFLRLSSEGLLRLYPKRGALIVPVTPGEVSDVLTARQLVEPWAVGVAVGMLRTRREALAEGLSALLATQRQALGDERLPDFHLADCQFHLAIVEAAGNELLGHFYRSLRDRQLRMLDTASIRDPGRRATILDQHQALLVAIREGKAIDAATTIAEHLGGTAEAFEAAPAPARP